jgi:hypothetical protein
MNLKEIGVYFIDAATILTLFLKAAWAQTIASLLSAIGMGLETGNGNVGPITVANLSTYEPYLIDAGSLLSMLFKAQWASTVSAFLLGLGAAIAMGGNSQPVRLGSESVTFDIKGNQVSFAFGPWQQQPNEAPAS